MTVFRVASLGEGRDTAREFEHIIKDMFKTPIPSIGRGTASTTSIIADARISTMPAGYPNQMFASAIDLNTIKRNIMTMDHPRLDADELEDQEAFIALSNYVISDLLDDEPDIYTIDDVKVRFR